MPTVNTKVGQEKEFPVQTFVCVTALVGTRAIIDCNLRESGAVYKWGSMESIYIFYPNLASEHK